MLVYSFEYSKVKNYELLVFFGGSNLKIKFYFMILFSRG